MRVSFKPDDNFCTDFSIYHVPTQTTLMAYCEDDTNGKQSDLCTCSTVNCTKKGWKAHLKIYRITDKNGVVLSHEDGDTEAIKSIIEDLSETTRDYIAHCPECHQKLFYKAIIFASPDFEEG